MFLFKNCFVLNLHFYYSRFAIQYLAMLSLVSCTLLTRHHFLDQLSPTERMNMCSKAILKLHFNTLILKDNLDKIL